MPKADAVRSTGRSRTPEFLIAVNRIRLSQLIRDPFVAAAFRAAEDDGLAPDLVDVDHPTVLGGGAAEILPATSRRLLAAAEG